MKKKLWIDCVQAECLVNRLAGFKRLAILVENPRQGIPCIDVVPDLQLVPREFQGFGQFDPLIRVEQGQFPVGQYPIQFAEVPDIFD